jgi:RNAse (barnase) inhibitor barstar
MSKHLPVIPLGDSGRAGVYHLPRGNIADLRSAAENQGLALFRIDLVGINTKDRFLAALAQALGFPEWFGRNWDALEDCLTDMSWQPAAGYVLILAHADEFRTADESSFALALRILQSAAEFWRDDGIPFWTLVGLHSNGTAFLPELP